MDRKRQLLAVVLVLGFLAAGMFFLFKSGNIVVIEKLSSSGYDSEP